VNSFGFPRTNKTGSKKLLRNRYMSLV